MDVPGPEDDPQRSLNDDEEREEAESDPTVDPDEADDVPYSGE
jgi:hypothetical protein